MCIQVDKRWKCGHIGFFKIKWCEKAFNGCKGTPAHHDIVEDDQRCGDCERRDSLPEPLVSR